MKNKLLGLLISFCLVCSVNYAGEVWIDGSSNEGHIIQIEGVTLAQQPILNFSGSGVSVANSGSKSVVTINGGGSVSDTAYDATSWDGVTTIAPSKNAVRDKIEGLAGGHDAVTIDTNVDDLLTLTGQALSYKSQTANQVFAVSGTTPTFRALVDNDIPNDITITESDPLSLKTSGTDIIKDTHIDWGSGASQVDLSDIPGGVSGANVWDFGGATSLEIPNGASPTVDAAGEIAVDITNDQLIYYGVAKRVIPYECSKCAVVEKLAAADDNKSLGMFNDAVTITGVSCSYVGSGSTPATLTLEDGSGNAMTITGTNPTCVASGTNATFTAVTANNTLVAGELVRFDVTNAVSPETDDYTICLKYITDAQ